MSAFAIVLFLDEKKSKVPQLGASRRATLEKQDADGRATIREWNAHVAGHLGSLDDARQAASAARGLEEERGRTGAATRGGRAPDVMGSRGWKLP